MKKLAIAVCLFIASSHVYAETQYVTDVLYITLRTGTGDQYRVMRALKSGTALEILDKTSDPDYFLVRTKKGEEGWVRQKYLVEEPIAAMKLEDAENKLSKVQKENDSLKGKLSSAQSEIATKEKELNQLENKVKKLSDEHEHMKKISAKPMALDKENKTLTKRNATLEKEIDTVRQENATLRENENRNWFLTGAGVIILGIMLGLVLPRLRMRKKSAWA